MSDDAHRRDGYYQGLMNDEPDEGPLPPWSVPQVAIVAVGYVGFEAGMWAKNVGEFSIL